MKKLIFLLISFAFTTVIKAQSPTGLKASWEDRDGRGFTITIPEGDISYDYYDDDTFQYDNQGLVIKISDFYISRHGPGGAITMIGDVYISYNQRGDVSKIGDMYILYDYQGRYRGREGKINNY